MNKTDQFINDLMRSPTNECVTWPFDAKNGTSPVVTRNGVHVRARRLILSRHSGVSIDCPLPVSRTCNSPLCVNPRHMRWGHSKRAEKLNEHEVKDIRVAARAGVTYAELAKSYGVSKVTVHNVVTRKTWKHVT